MVSVPNVFFDIWSFNHDLFVLARDKKVYTVTVRCFFAAKVYKKVLLIMNLPSALSGVYFTMSIFFLNRRL